MKKQSFRTAKKVQPPSAEYALLSGLKPYLNYTQSASYPVGIGDDAAVRVTTIGERLVFTADTFVESVHFSFDYMSGKEVGYKAMVINISDCAAMGATPDAALVQVVFPAALPAHKVQAQMHKLYGGMNEALCSYDFPVVGGNLSKGPCWILDITLIGKIPARGRPLMRTGVHSGDYLWVTGTPGSSAAGLAALKKWRTRKDVPQAYRSLVRAHVHPEARIAAGLACARNKAVHAMIDISDGIAKECRTMSYDNNLGIILDDVALLSLASPMRGLADKLKTPVRDWLLYGGEDYELLFAAAPEFDPALLPDDNGCGYTCIGIVTDAISGVHIRESSGMFTPVTDAGWDHLKKPLHCV